jgi:hypothetical protein
MRRVLLVLLLICGPASAHAQQPLPLADAPVRTIRGVVADASDGAALRRARITVTSGQTAVASVFTDDEGRFSVGVPSGAALSMRIVKAGYASIGLPVPPLHVGAAEPLRIEVPRGATIVGRAIDASGQPAQALVVRREPSQGAAWVPGGPLSAPLTAQNTFQVSALGPWGVTAFEHMAAVLPDDRGEYRVGGLLPGRYVVEAYSSPVVYTIDGSGLPTLRVLGTPTAGAGTSAFRPGSVVVDVRAGLEASADVLLERPTSQALPANPVSDGTGSTISGIVSTMEGAPVADATVSASRSGVGGAQIARTDSFGRFTLRGIDPGSVSVRASKRGYAESQHGQRGGGLPGLPVTIEAGKDVHDLSIVLPRTGAISGLVIDEHGEPLQEAGVLLLRVRREPTGALVPLRDQGAPIRRTSDDRGQFRVSDIVPGDYILMASLPAETVDPSAALRAAYIPAYYPDTSDFASASPIRIIDGEVIPGLTLTMRRVPVVRVAGVAHTAKGTPFTGTVRLTSRHAAPPAAAERFVSPGPGGEFAFADVPPGDYLLRALVPSGPAGPELGAASVTVVDRDPEPLTIRTSPGSRVSGRMVLEGGRDDVLWGYFAASAPLDSASSPVSVSNLGAPVTSGESFTLEALAGLTRLRVWSDDQNWYVKSILIDGFDVTDTPFDFGFEGRTYSDVEVVFSRLGASIAGGATDERATAVRDYAVYVFATDRDKWVAGSRWVRLARSVADGGFKVPSLPSGEYWVAAIDRVDGSAGAADQPDAELLEMLSSRAARVTLSEGEARTISLQLVRR